MADVEEGRVAERDQGRGWWGRRGDDVDAEDVRDGAPAWVRVRVSYEARLSRRTVAQVLGVPAPRSRRSRAGDDEGERRGERGLT